MTDKEIKEITALQTQVKAVLQHKSSGAASLYFNNTIQFIGEYVLYLLGIGCFVFPFIMKSIAPFHILKEITESDRILEVIPSRGEINTFDIAIKGLIILCGLLFIYIGMNLRTIRKKNNLLHKAFSTLNAVGTFVDQQVKSLLPVEPKPFSGDLKIVEPKDIRLEE